MSELVLIGIGVFLPLFPFSMIFNVIYARVSNVLLRSVLLIAWPQIGIVLIVALDHPIPEWLFLWAVGTSLLYAFRALALRDVGLWTCFLATSAWALLWLSVAQVSNEQLHLYALGFSVPLILLAFLGAALEHRFGAAYTDLYGGLAVSLPRFSALLVMVVLAVIAMPLFPSFFTLLTTITNAMGTAPVLAVVVALVWLLWSWAGTRLIQGLIVGTYRGEKVDDLNLGTTWSYVLALSALAFVGISWIGA